MGTHLHHRTSHSVTMAQALIDGAQAFVATRQAELLSSYALGLRSLETKTLPGANDFTVPMVMTTVCAAMMVNAALMSLTKSGRATVGSAFEAMITFILLIVLILLVLGVPVGFMYTGFLALKYAWVFAGPFIMPFVGQGIDFVKSKIA